MEISTDHGVQRIIHDGLESVGHTISLCVLHMLTCVLLSLFKKLYLVHVTHFCSSFAVAPVIHYCEVPVQNQRDF